MGFLWASLRPLSKMRCLVFKGTVRLSSELFPALRPVIHATAPCPLWARHYTGLRGGALPATSSLAPGLLWCDAATPSQ